MGLALIVPAGMDMAGQGEQERHGMIANRIDVATAGIG